MKRDLPKEKLRILGLLSKKEQIKLLNFCIENTIPVFKRTFNIKSDKEFKYYIWDGEELQRGCNNDIKYRDVTLNEFKNIMSIQKEKTFSITESQIKEFYKITEIHSAQKYIEKLFPETVEFNLEIGKWYKSTVSESISMFNGINKESYGIHTSGKEWIQSHRWFFTGNEYLKKWIEATEQEVFEALKNEAVKRGFVEGNYFEVDNGTDGINKIIGEITFEVGYLYNNGWRFFFNGEFSKIIPTITLSEAEQQLKKKIIV